MVTLGNSYNVHVLVRLFICVILGGFLSKNPIACDDSLALCFSTPLLSQELPLFHTERHALTRGAIHCKQRNVCPRSTSLKLKSQDSQS